MAKHGKKGFTLVPTRRVGMLLAPRCGKYGHKFGSDARSPNSGRGASRLHSHAARGNEDKNRTYGLMREGRGS
jgi:hypothetical protein